MTLRASGGTVTIELCHGQTFRLCPKSATSFPQRMRIAPLPDEGGLDGDFE